MDIAALARKGVNTAFGIASQAVVDVTLTTGVNEASTYDPATGKFTGAGTSRTVKGMLYQTQVQKAGQDAAKTSTVMLRTEELAAAGYTGKITDGDVITVDGVKYEILRADIDPVGVIWIIEVRR